MIKSKAQLEAEQQALLTTTSVSTSIRNEEEIKKIALSKTVIIENLNLYLGLTAKEIIRWIKESLIYHGERGDITIIDFNMNPFNIAFNNSSISL